MSDPSVAPDRRSCIVHDHRSLVSGAVSEALGAMGVDVVAVVPTLTALEGALAEHTADVVLSSAAAATIAGLKTRHRLVRLADERSLTEIVAETTSAAAAKDHRRRGNRGASSAAHLTPREVSVLELVAAGLTARQIAGQLGISARTVDNRKQSAFAKLGVSSQAEAVARALSEGRLGPGPTTAESAS